MKSGQQVEPESPGQDNQQVSKGLVSSSNPQQPSSAIGVIRQSPISGQPSAPGVNSTVSPSKTENQDPSYPLSASDAISMFDCLNDFEKQEIFSFDKEIYYVGQDCKRKIKGHVIS